MATAPKSNAVYVAYNEAAEAAASEIAEPVPLHLRNAPTGLMKSLDYGKGYRYAHNEAEGIAAEMECLPPAHQGRTFYRPTDRGEEREIKARLAALRAAKTKAPEAESSRGSKSKA
jgi:putative ATPase